MYLKSRRSHRAPLSLLRDKNEYGKLLDQSSKSWVDGRVQIPILSRGRQEVMVKQNTYDATCFKKSQS